MRINRITRTAMAVALTAAISACGAAGSSADGKTTIGFSQATQNHPFRVAMTEGNREWAEAHDVKLVVTDAQDNPAKQVADIQSMIAQGIKTIIVSPNQAAPLTPAIQQAEAQGVKIITADREVDTKVTEHIGGDNTAIGQEAAAYLADAMGNKGAVIEIQGTAGASATNERHEGFAKILKKEHPDITVEATDYADYLRQPAQKFMEDMLQRFGPGEIQGVYAHNDEMALGAIQALEAAGRLDEVDVISIDGQNEAIDAVKAGKLLATFAYPTCAPESVEQALKVANGEDVPAQMTLDAPRIDATNVEEWLGKGF